MTVSGCCVFGLEASNVPTTRRNGGFDRHERHTHSHAHHAGTESVSFRFSCSLEPWPIAWNTQFCSSRDFTIPIEFPNYSTFCLVSNMYTIRRIAYCILMNVTLRPAHCKPIVQRNTITLAGSAIDRFMSMARNKTGSTISSSLHATIIPIMFPPL